MGGIYRSYMPLGRVLRSWLWSLGLWLCAMNVAVADVRCHGIEVTTYGASPADVTLVCNGIANDDNHIGTYSAADSRIDLLSFARAGKFGEVFRSPMTKSLYISFVEHELAHAVADRHFAPTATSRLAHEYIAVAQLSSLPDEGLHGILAGYPLEGFENTGAISLLHYQLNPGAFGVKAYLHSRGLADRSGFIQRLLKGEAGHTAESSVW